MGTSSKNTLTKSIPPIAASAASDRFRIRTTSTRYFLYSPETSSNLHDLYKHLKSSVHVGKNVKCPWCTDKFTNLTGVCLHLESGSCTSGVNREMINEYCREVDSNHVFTNKQTEWYDGASSTTNIASQASWDGSFYRCYFCTKGFNKLSSLNQHLASPAHEQRIYHCPRCKREYIALSGLVNHLESESCGAFRFMGSPAGLGFVNQLSIGQ